MNLKAWDPLDDELEEDEDDENRPDKLVEVD